MAKQVFRIVSALMALTAFLSAGTAVTAAETPTGKTAVTKPAPPKAPAVLGTSRTLPVPVPPQMQTKPIAPGQSQERTGPPEQVNMTYGNAKTNYRQQSEPGGESHPPRGYPLTPKKKDSSQDKNDSMK